MVGDLGSKRKGEGGRVAQLPGDVVINSDTRGRFGIAKDDAQGLHGQREC